jgi:hypothetical protein
VSLFVQPFARTFLSIVAGGIGDSASDELTSLL